MIATDSTTATAAEEVLSKLAEALNPMMDQAIDEATVRQIATDAAAEAVTAARLPRPIEVHLSDGAVHKLDGRTHRQFDELLALVEEGHPNIMLVGPAGTGKTTLAKHVAKALDRKFAFISLSAGVTETHIFGRMLPQSDSTWAYVESPFVRIYRNGGVFLFDEVDAADGNVMVSVNAALANGVMCNPVTGEVIERHPDCLILTAANTFGRGGDMVYVGRNALDGATLDRFILATLIVAYDTDLESDLAASLPENKSSALLTWVTMLRNRIAEYRLRRVASTRLVVNAVKALAAARTLEQVKARYFQDWSKDELAKAGEEVR